MMHKNSNLRDAFRYHEGGLSAVLAFNQDCDIFRTCSL